MWKVNILTLFPEIFPGPLGLSMTGKALKAGLWECNVFNIRDFALNKHKTVDDSPYGGGTGMVIKADVLANAIDNCLDLSMPIIYLSPRGKLFNQPLAQGFAAQKGINLICGRFEGVDERIFLEYSITEVSIGDYVLSSGDVAALPFIDACIRHIPGVLDEKDALLEETFGLDEKYANLLEYPHYTKPAEWLGHEVPDVLLSGNHKNINEWRLQKAIEKTKDVRPELLDRCSFLKEKLK